MKLKLFCFILLFTCFSSSKFGFSQTVLNDKLIKIAGWEVRHIDNPFFKEYFEVIIDQKLNHDDPKSETFKQRFCVGYNGLDVPNIMELDGYAIDYAVRKGHVDELSKTLKCNLVTIEHRYFGKSVPIAIGTKKIDLPAGQAGWKYLTIKQAANDCHAIKLVLETMMKGKWLVTGVSKGGQTALAYRMYYPLDVEGAVLIGTPVRKDANDKRLIDYFEKQSQTECGKKIIEYQKIMLRGKSNLLPLFEKFSKEKNITYGKFSTETIYEYAVLYYPFCFYQACGNCDEIPSDSSEYRELVKSLFEIVPPKFFSAENKHRSNASFYMFYNELGNYEYDIKPFAKMLKNESYLNSVFCPEQIKIKFDKSYLTALNSFIQKTATKNIFIYGEKDPWASLQPEVNGKNQNYKYIISGSCHKSKIADLAPEQKKELYRTLGLWLECKVPE